MLPSNLEGKYYNTSTRAWKSRYVFRTGSLDDDSLVIVLPGVPYDQSWDTAVCVNVIYDVAHINKGIPLLPHRSVQFRY